MKPRKKRNDARHSRETRIERARLALTTIWKSEKAFTTGRQIGDALDMVELTGLGAVRKDVYAYLREAGVDPDEVLTITGENPRKYYRGPKIETGILALSNLAGKAEVEPLFV